MHGHMNVNLSRCTVTWTSIYHDARSHERQFMTMHGHMNVKFLKLYLRKRRETADMLKHHILWRIHEMRKQNLPERLEQALKLSFDYNVAPSSTA